VRPHADIANIQLTGCRVKCMLVNSPVATAEADSPLHRQNWQCSLYW